MTEADESWKAQERQRREVETIEQMAEAIKLAQRDQEDEESATVRMLRGLCLEAYDMLFSAAEDAGWGEAVDDLLEKLRRAGR